MVLKQAFNQKKRGSLLLKIPAQQEVGKGREGLYPQQQQNNLLPLPKPRRSKINLDFSEKGQEGTTHSENILNLPYSDSEEEQEEGADLALQVVSKIEQLP